MIYRAMQEKPREMPTISLDCDPAVFSDLLQFMYTGEVCVSISKYKELSAKAEKYGLTRLLSLFNFITGMADGNSEVVGTTYIVPQDYMDTAHESNNTLQHTDSPNLPGITVPVVDVSQNAHLVPGTTVSDVGGVKQEVKDSNINEAELRNENIDATSIPVIDHSRTIIVSPAFNATLTSERANDANLTAADSLSNGSSSVLTEQIILKSVDGESIVVKREPSSDEDEGDECEDFIIGVGPPGASTSHNPEPTTKVSEPATVHHGDIPPPNTEPKSTPCVSAVVHPSAHLGLTNTPNPEPKGVVPESTNQHASDGFTLIKDDEGCPVLVPPGETQNSCLPKLAQASETTSVAIATSSSTEDAIRVYKIHSYAKQFAKPFVFKGDWVTSGMQSILEGVHTHHRKRKRHGYTNQKKRMKPILPRLEEREGLPQDRWRYCTECGLKGYDSLKLVNHIRQWHGFEQAVDHMADLEKEMTPVRELSRDGSKMHLRLKCNKCDFKAADELRVFQHKFRKHKAMYHFLKPKQCKYCRKTFVSNTALSSHEKYHKVCKKPQLRQASVCSICGKVYTTMNGCRMHENTVHFGYYKVSCRICKKVFPNKNCLKSHLLIHKTSKPFHCSDCPYKSCVRANLRSHLLKHHGKVLTKQDSCYHRHKVESSESESDGADEMLGRPGEKGSQGSSGIEVNQGDNNRINPESKQGLTEKEQISSLSSIIENGSDGEGKGIEIQNEKGSLPPSSFEVDQYGIGEDFSVSTQAEKQHRIAATEETDSQSPMAQHIPYMMTQHIPYSPN